MTRCQALCCLLLALALAAAGAVAAPATVGDAPPVLADEGKDEGGIGNGIGNGNGDDKEEKKDDKDKEDDKGNERGAAIKPAAPYRVEVACAYDRQGDRTTCAFAGVAPPGAKDVSHVDLPAAEVCAEVVGGDAEYVDPDPNTGVVGYKSRGGEGAFTLVLAGEATAGGAATYWFKTGDGVFPATGPGLVCGEVAGQQAVEVTAEAGVRAEATAITIGLPPLATAAADGTATGAVVVRTYACAEEAPPAGFDWYGGCEPGVEGVPFALEGRHGTAPPAAGEGATDAAGLVRFAALAPGTYRLAALDTVWCHAESDSVDVRGELVVEAGTEVTAWVFLCGAEATK